MSVTMRLKLVVNGRERNATVPPMKRLLDVLRQDLGLTGTKEGCGEGECGACSVLIDGRTVCSCLVPAAQAEGKRVVTVEGLARGNRLSELQQAFLESGGAQCGICTPGMLITSMELLGRMKGRVPSDEEVREALAGNLCRCTGYQKIVDAVRGAARRIGAEHANAKPARAKAKRARAAAPRAKSKRAAAASGAKPKSGAARAKSKRAAAASGAKPKSGAARTKSKRVAAASGAKPKSAAARAKSKTVSRAKPKQARTAAPSRSSRRRPSPPARRTGAAKRRRSS